jgi:hypothetical protein
LSERTEWPFGASRVEFLISGFADEKFLFAFERTPIKRTCAVGVEDADYAKCGKCGTHVFPKEEALREHGRLHVAVEIARRPNLQFGPDGVTPLPVSPV